MSGKNAVRTNKEEEELIGSPVTTPGSVDEERYLVPPFNVVKNKVKISLENMPLAIYTVSALEIIFFQILGEHAQKCLRFEPNKILQVWRLFTYMLVHDDRLHLIQNVIMQILFAFLLEIRHGRIRILALYLAGGMTGAFGASCFNSDIVIGASAGVYALLIAHCSDLLMNYENMKYKVYHLLCIFIIVVFDIGYNNIHTTTADEPSISWTAHFFGGITGLFLGLVLFKKEENAAKTRKQILFWTGIILYSVLVISLVIITIEIRRCTPSSIMWRKYMYTC